MIKSKGRFLCASICLAGVLGSPAWAQATASATTTEAVPADTSTDGIDEIIVTAQRREQSLQDVPIAITAITADALAASGITNTQELDQLTPGLVSTVSAGIPQRFLRGVGSQTVALYEQPVATYVDGVYIASGSGSLFSFNNIERIEVLRGPQGTLFGRNATGGVVQVITRAPQQDPEVDVRASYSNYDTIELAGFAGAGLGEGAAANLAVYFRDQGKGYGRNIPLGNRVQEQDDFAIRGQVGLDPTERFNIRLSADYTKQESDIGLVRQVLLGNRNAVGGTRVGGIQDGNSDIRSRGKNSQWGVSANMGYEASDDVTLRSITAYRKFEYYAFYDTDTIPLGILNAERFENAKSFQQEFLATGTSGALDWTVGAFYLDLSNTQEPVATFGTNAAGNLDRFSDQSVRSLAGYAQGTFAVTEDLNLTAGLRYTSDKTEIDGRFVSRAGFPGGAGIVLQTAVDREVKDSKLTYRFGADYSFSDDVLGYVSASRGFKSGSFNNGSLTQAPTRPEVLDAYEAGLKTELFDKTVRFNLTAFTYRYKDIQLNSVSLPNIFLINAASAKIDGAEVELLVAPKIETGNLRFGGALSILDARYDDFPNAQFFLPNPFTTVPAGLTCATPTSAAPGGNTNCTFDASGNRMLRAPKWTLNLSADYRFPVGDGEVGLSANYFHNAGFFWEQSNRTRQAAYDVVNAEISYTLPGGNMELALFAKNLFDEEYYSSVSESAVGDVATPNPPRTYGVSLRYKFGG